MSARRARQSPVRRGRGSRRSRDERGVAAILAGIFVTALLFPLCAVSVDVARWYVEIQRVQNAADAAATAGVTFLPDNFAAAKARAIDIAEDNGYAVSSLVSVDVKVGDKPTQLRVTITSEITNSFAGAFANGLSLIQETAVADFNAPVPLGSPCNAFGNEPPGYNVGSADDTNTYGPQGSVIVAPTGGAQCTSNPQFWAAVAGPDTDKGSGDAYMTRTCSSTGFTYCDAGKKNSEFDPLGYFYAVHIGKDAVNTDVTVQVFDPAWVEVGDNCTGPTVSSGNPFRDNENDATPSGAITRYGTGTATGFCTGDTLAGGTTDPITTSFAMREPTSTYDPAQGKPMPACLHQYDGIKADQVTSNALDQKTSTFNPQLAKVFRQWIKLCTFRPTQTGDYYIQVRTNVKRSGADDGWGGWSSNSASDPVFTQMGDDPSVHGAGNNRYSIRIKGTKRSAVSVTGEEHFSLYANYSGAVSTFNLVRVIPAAATKTLNIGFWDMGDAPQAGTLQVLPPTDSNITSLTGCQGSGVFTGSMTDCKLSNVGSNYNGRWQYVSIPIPPSYTCNSTQGGGCWFRVQAAFPNTAPTDTTTWTASIDGDPVRLIE